jgi:hypothetical protein
MLSRTILALYFIITFLTVSPAESRIIDRVVASVNDRAITLSELEEKYEVMKKVSPSITYKDVLETMINRILLLNDAKKYRMEGASDDALVQQYIDLKIRPLIKIPDEEVRKYYEQNREKFGGVNYEDAYNNIVNYLTELQINGQLIKQVEMLRADAHIIINLDISGEK